MLTLETRVPLPFTYEATGTPPAIALFDEGRTSGAPVDSSGAPAAAGVPWSRPSACCEFMAPAIDAASWPSRPRASGNVVVLHAQQAAHRAAGNEAVGQRSSSCCRC